MWRCRLYFEPLQRNLVVAVTPFGVLASSQRWPSQSLAVLTLCAGVFTGNNCGCVLFKFPNPSENSVPTVALFAEYHPQNPFCSDLYASRIMSGERLNFMGKCMNERCHFLLLCLPLPCRLLSNLIYFNLRELRSWLLRFWSGCVIEGLGYLCIHWMHLGYILCLIKQERKLT